MSLKTTRILILFNKETYFYSVYTIAVVNMVLSKYWYMFYIRTVNDGDVHTTASIIKFYYDMYEYY